MRYYKELETCLPFETGFGHWPKLKYISFFLLPILKNSEHLMLIVVIKQVNRSVTGGTCLSIVEKWWPQIHLFTDAFTEWAIHNVGKYSYISQLV